MYKKIIIPLMLLLFVSPLVTASVSTDSNNTHTMNIRYIYKNGHGSLPQALKKIVPPDWTTELSPEVSRHFHRSVSWQGNDQWSYVLDKMLRKYGLQSLKNSDKKHLVIDYLNTERRTAPSQRWELKKGSTLRDSLTEWASSTSCGNFTWTLVWNTQVNYRIDAPLLFHGDFESALKDTLTLYLSAEKPLYAFRNIAQCVITIKDSSQE